MKGAGYEYESAGGCLRIRLSGDDIVRQTAATVQALAELIERENPRVTLIDFRDVPATMTFAERYGLGELTGRYLPGRFIGTLVRPDQADRGRIGMLVANNRGALIEVFADEPSAEAWAAERIGSPRRGP